MSSSAELPFVSQPPGAPAVVTAAADRAAARWGLPEPVLLRLAMNGIFAAGDDVVLRVGRTNAPAEGAVRLAAELGRAGIRVPAPLRSEAFRDGDLEVIAVERIHPVGGVDWVAVGEMIRRLHALDPRVVPDGYPVPWCGSFPWWQFAGLLDDVRADLDPPAVRALEGAVARQLPLLEAARSGPLVVCHGDVHPGNVLQAADGPVLLDWDLLCLGPPAWDHAPLLTWSERWGGEAGLYEAFARGVGGSLRGDPLAEAIAMLRLVAATALRVRAGRDDPAAADEAARRLRWWRGEPDAPPWRAM